MYRFHIGLKRFQNINTWLNGSSFSCHILGIFQTIGIQYDGITGLQIKLILFILKIGIYTNWESVFLFKYLNFFSSPEYQRAFMTTVYVVDFTCFKIKNTYEYRDKHHRIIILRQGPIDFGNLFDHVRVISV